MLKSLPKLSRQELEVACEDFSNIIGSTPETVVYKGTMKDGPEVSVISLCAFEGHWTSQHELFYQNKVVGLSRNMVQKWLLTQFFELMGLIL